MMIRLTDASLTVTATDGLLEHLANLAVRATCASSPLVQREQRSQVLFGSIRKVFHRHPDTDVDCIVEALLYHQKTCGHVQDGLGSDGCFPNMLAILSSGRGLDQVFDQQVIFLEDVLDELRYVVSARQFDSFVFRRKPVPKSVEGEQTYQATPLSLTLLPPREARRCHR